MSNKSSNFEPSDELLSAYIDGELTTDERAAVEARLATDPAAQQLLHELRSVSQSLQAMPTESLGRDLSEEIIRRARVVYGSPVPAPAAGRRSSPPDSAPNIRVFHSKRAWIWASMALAAGLLIMVVQSVNESAKDLPPVAVRDHDSAQIQPADKAARPSRRDISVSAAPKSPAAPPATIVSEGSVKEKQLDTVGGAMPAAPVASGSYGVELKSADKLRPASEPPLAAASPALKPRKEIDKSTTELDDATSSFTTLPEPLATDKSAPAAQPTGRFSGPGGAAGISAAKQKSESIVGSTDRPFYVVHVVATPDALKRGSFDRLLAHNKFEFVPQDSKTQLGLGGGKLAKQVQDESEVLEQSNKAEEMHTAKAEMVLVEAPAPAIELFLSDLNKNANDFVSITVNEGQPPQNRSAAESTASRSLAEAPTNLRRFNRGATPDPQKDTIDVRKYLYAQDLDKPRERAASGSPRAGGFGGEAGNNTETPRDTSGREDWDYNEQPVPEIRRARSIATRGIDNRQSANALATADRTPRSQSAPALQPGAATTNQPLSQRGPTERPEAKEDNQNNNLKVLFVFTPEEKPAPVAPADGRPK